MAREPSSAPGPFRAGQIRQGDPYELSDGHAIRCMTAGGRHGLAHMAGGHALVSDPAVAGRVALDVGIAFNGDKNLRAPDIIVGAVEAVPGWQRTFPPLAVEYADTGQDEGELAEKIQELLAGGTQLVWVVRLVGPLRVEVHAAGKAMRVVGAEDELAAPGILANPVPVRALVDTAAANVAALRNLLSAYGYRSVEEIEAKAQAEGQARALLTILATRGFVPEDARVAEIRATRDAALLQRWIARAVTAATVDAVFEP